jgi:hypothetical protein
MILSFMYTLTNLFYLWQIYQITKPREWVFSPCIAFSMMFRIDFIINIYCTCKLINNIIDARR